MTMVTTMMMETMMTMVTPRGRYSTANQFHSDARIRMVACEEHSAPIEHDTSMILNSFEHDPNAALI